MSEIYYIVMRAKEEGERDDSSEAPIPTPGSEESVEEGMTSGFKELWSGPEDKFGKFKWLDKKPDDLGKPAEDSESAKWALIVRHVRVHNDPRKVLKIHSIVVQSPLLKELLGRVLKDYPGVTTTLQRLTFSGRFEPLIHRWNELKEAVASEENATTKEHADLLMGILEKEFEEVIDESLDMKANGVMTFTLLWTLYQPDGLLYTRLDGQERALKTSDTQYGTDSNGNAVFWVTGQYVDWDGTRFGTIKLNLSLHSFTGTMDITRLRVFPFHMHPSHTTLREKLLERGAKVESLAGIHYKQYSGVAWTKTQFGNDRMNCRERIVLDGAAFNKNNPNSATYVQAFHSPHGSRLRRRRRSFDFDIESDQSDGTGDAEYGTGSLEDEDNDGMPYDGFFPDNEDQEQVARKPLTEEQKILASPALRGYALTSKLWLNFFVTCVKEITFNEDAFRSLVLPENQKELILGFTETQNKCKDTFDDVIQGKGRGIILLLCGPPGVGKTLTAESVSEQMRVPLYAMSAGDLGLDPRNVERTLTNTLEMCADWNAVLLLDEADIFLEQRSLHELERNKLVTIFLRVLEYYKGIMFLTTNRVQTFDAAFQSRIHISLDYPELSAESRLTVWQNFLSRSAPTPLPITNGDADVEPKTDVEADAEVETNGEPKMNGEHKTNGVAKPNGETAVKPVNVNEHTITASQMKKLAQIELNGRQIKNTIKTSKLLASRRDQKLSYEHIMTVLDVTQHWHNTTRETDRARSAIYY